MPVRVVFKCEYCDARPDDETQRALEAQLQELQLLQQEQHSHRQRAPGPPQQLARRFQMVRCHPQ